MNELKELAEKLVGIKDEISKGYIEARKVEIPKEILAFSTIRKRVRASTFGYFKVSDGVGYWVKVNSAYFPILLHKKEDRTIIEIPNYSIPRKLQRERFDKLIKAVKLKKWETWRKMLIQW